MPLSFYRKVKFKAQLKDSSLWKIAWDDLQKCYDAVCMVCVTIISTIHPTALSCFLLQHVPLWSMVPSVVKDIDS